MARTYQAVWDYNNNNTNALLVKLTHSTWQQTFSYAPTLGVVPPSTRLEHNSILLAPTQHTTAQPLSMLHQYNQTLHIGRVRRSSTSPTKHKAW